MNGQFIENVHVVALQFPKPINWALPLGYACTADNTSRGYRTSLGSDLETITSSVTLPSSFFGHPILRIRLADADMAIEPPFKNPMVYTHTYPI